MARTKSCRFLTSTFIYEPEISPNVYPFGILYIIQRISITIGNTLESLLTFFIYHIYAERIRRGDLIVCAPSGTCAIRNTRS